MVAQPDDDPCVLEALVDDVVQRLAEGYGDPLKDVLETVTIEEGGCDCDVETFAYERDCHLCGVNRWEYNE